MNNKKILINRCGQSSLEFFILVFAAIFIFLGLLFIVQLNVGDEVRENLDREVREVALTVQDEINLAVSSSEGYRREFTLPDNVANREYEINITAGMVYIRTVDGEFAYAYPALNVTGDVRIGTNIIRKVGEDVYLN